MKFESGYFKDSASSNYRDYDTEKKYSEFVFELIEIFDMKKSDYILDFGCATGVLLKEFYSRGYTNITGTDVSYWAISEGKRKPGIGENLHYYNLNLLNSYFDYVFFFDVLEHINGPELENIFSLLNTPNVIVKIPVSKKEGEPFFLEVSRKDVSHIQCHTKEWWIELFKKFDYLFVGAVEGKVIYDSEGLFAAQFSKNIAIKDMNCGMVIPGRGIFSAAIIYIDKQHFGLDSFLENVGNYVDTVWVVYDGVTNIKKIERLTSAKIKNIYLETPVGKGKAIKKIIKNLINDEEIGVVLLVEFNRNGPIYFIPRLLQQINAGYADVVVGSRFLGHMPEMSHLRKLFNQFVTMYFRWWYQFACTDCLTGYIALSKKAIDKIEIDESKYGLTAKIVKEVIKKKIKYNEIGISVPVTNMSFWGKIIATKDVLKVILSK